METVIDTQAVENFVKLAKNSKNKEEYLKRVRQFDQRFVDSYPAPTINHPPSVPRSTTNSNRDSFKPNHFEPPKNPFVSQHQDRFRQTGSNIKNPYQHTSYKSGVSNMPPVPHSHSENNFYRPEESYMEQIGPSFVNYYGNQGYQGNQGAQQGYQGAQQGYQGIQQGSQYNQGNYANEENMYRQSSNSQFPPQVNQQPRGGQAYNPGPMKSNTNQYLANLEEEPQYVKYYKKVVPTPQNKVYTPTQRTNPFKGN